MKPYTKNIANEINYKTQRKKGFTKKFVVQSSVVGTASILPLLTPTIWRRWWWRTGMPMKFPVQCRR